MEANTAKKKELENNTESPQISVQNSETNNLVKPQQSTLSKSALKKLRRRQEWYRVYFFYFKISVVNLYSALKIFFQVRFQRRTKTKREGKKEGKNCKEEA